ncbi:MAG: potassium transporter, partial [Candidatus Competibacteraceae bacterium]|nr:potassium transporter [Candidatus Competibacteraceae bacterium]
VLPMLGVGGMQLYRAEIPGPVKDEKLTPRLARTAQLFWLFYVGLTVLGALAFWAAGMTPFDAIGHSFSAISTGGFSTHDASLGFFNSPLIEAIAIVLMLAGAMNFSVHFLSWRQRSLKVYWRNEEVRAFLLIVLGLTVLIAVCLYFSGRYGMLASLRHSAFTLVSIITSTGFITEAFAEWPVFLSLLLIYISFIGGCAGSTAGGVKVVRILLLLKQSYREI